MEPVRIEQFFLGCLAHASYLIASDGIAAVRRGGSGGVVVAALGALTHADLDNLVRLRHQTPPEAASSRR